MLRVCAYRRPIMAGWVRSIMNVKTTHPSPLTSAMLSDSAGRAPSQISAPPTDGLTRGTGTVAVAKGGGGVSPGSASPDLLNRMMTLRVEDKHDEVIRLWKAIQTETGEKLNKKVLATVVASAYKRGEHAFVIDTVENAVALGVLPEQGTLLSFMKACAGVGELNGSGGWAKAVGMLEKMKGNNALNSPIFEEVATICFSGGKWRRALDVLNQMLERDFKLSEKIQTNALLACASVIDRGALKAAYQLFRNAVFEKTPMNPRVFAALISGFSEAGMHAEADAVWNHLAETEVPMTDAICAARIGQLGHTGHADEAAEVVNLSMSLKAQNRQSINNMTNVLLKAGRIEDACAYLKAMAALKKVKLTSQLVEYHVKALAQGGHANTAVSFLQYWRTFQKEFDHHALGKLWQELFNDCIYLGKYHGAELCYRHASNPSNAMLGIDSRGWLARLFSEVGEVGQGKYLLHLTKSLSLTEPAADSAAIFSLIRSMCLCRMFVECVDLHQSVVIEAGRSELGSSHLLVYILCRQDMWREAKMVIKDIHRQHGNRVGCLPQLFTQVVQIAGKTVKGSGQTSELWDLQQQLACRPTWNCTRYSIKVLFAECQWEKCLDLYVSRHICKDYHGHRLDQKTMTRVIKAYGYLERWMDAMEVFADYVEEAGLQSGGRAESLLATPSNEANSKNERMKKNVNIDIVIAVVMEILNQHGQECLIPNVLSRLVEKGISISEFTLKEAFWHTSSDNSTTTTSVHRRIFLLGLRSGYSEEVLRRAYRKGAPRGKLS